MQQTSNDLDGPEPPSPTSPVSRMRRAVGALGRAAAAGATLASREAAKGSRAAARTARHAAVGTTEVLVDGSVAVARGTRTGIGWTIVQWRAERRTRREKYERAADEYGGGNGAGPPPGAPAGEDGEWAAPIRPVRPPSDS
jgi:hypothetical protein